MDIKKDIVDIIREDLFNNSEEKYQKFSSSLLPGTKNILGVRLPYLRKIAKEISKDYYIEYLYSDRHIYFEETMICAMAIGCAKEDIKEKLIHIKNFVPKIDNWSICDSFCNSLKLVKYNQEKVFEFLLPYFNSSKTYEVRFAIVMILNYFINKDYLDKIFKIFDSIDNKDYYAEMALAWAISMCYINFPKETKDYLRNCKISDFAYNKSIQKICESRKVPIDIKNTLKKLKR